VERAKSRFPQGHYMSHNDGGIDTTIVAAGAIAAANAAAVSRLQHTIYQHCLCTTACCHSFLSQCIALKLLDKILG